MAGGFARRVKAFSRNAWPESTSKNLAYVSSAAKNWCSALLKADVTEFDGPVSELSPHCLSCEKKPLNPYWPESVAQTAAVLPRRSTL